MDQTRPPNSNDRPILASSSTLGDTDHASSDKTGKLLKYDPVIKISDFLNSFAVVISATALFFAWQSDTKLKEKEHANEVRKAAAVSLAKLERWEELSEWAFEELQPKIVEASELLVKTRDLVQTRDFFVRR